MAEHDIAWLTGQLDDLGGDPVDVRELEEPVDAPDAVVGIAERAEPRELVVHAGHGRGAERAHGPLEPARGVLPDPVCHAS